MNIETIKTTEECVSKPELLLRAVLGKVASIEQSVSTPLLDDALGKLGDYMLKHNLIDITKIPGCGICY